VFGISPDVDLCLMVENQGLAASPRSSLRRLAPPSPRWRPDVGARAGRYRTASNGLLRLLPEDRGRARLRADCAPTPSTTLPREINRRLIAPLADTISHPPAARPAPWRRRGARLLYSRHRQHGDRPPAANRGRATVFPRPRSSGRLERFHPALHRGHPASARELRPADARGLQGLGRSPRGIYDVECVPVHPNPNVRARRR